MTKYKKADDGCYINVDLIYEFGVVPFYDEDKPVFLIKYWQTDGEEHQIPGWFETEKEANIYLDNFMEDLL